MEKMWAGQTAPFFCPLNADYALANSIMRESSGVRVPPVGGGLPGDGR